MLATNISNMSRTRYSHGVICFATLYGKLHVLMVEKNITYAFVNFVSGNYNSNDNIIRSLFNQMTIDEKIDISLYDFDILWYKIYRIHPDDLHLHTKGIRNRYNVFRARYKSKIESIGRKKLLDLLNQTICIRNYWEFPKGLSHPRESSLDSALREFREESGISTNTIKILSSTPITSFNQSFSRSYIKKYYVAYHPNPNKVVVRFNDKSTYEVRNISWISVDEIDSFNINRYNKQVLSDAIEIIQKTIYYGSIIPGDKANKQETRHKGSTERTIKRGTSLLRR